MKRAERRHEEGRVGAMWLRRLRRGRPPTMPEAHDVWARKYAPRFAHHNKCPCDTCTGRRTSAAVAGTSSRRRPEHAASSAAAEATDDCDASPSRTAQAGRFVSLSSVRAAHRAAVFLCRPPPGAPWLRGVTVEVVGEENRILIVLAWEPPRIRACLPTSVDRVPVHIIVEERM